MQDPPLPEQTILDERARTLQIDAAVLVAFLVSSSSVNCHRINFIADFNRSVLLLPTANGPWSIVDYSRRVHSSVHR